MGFFSSPFSPPPPQVRRGDVKGNHKPLLSPRVDFPRTSQKGSPRGGAGFAAALRKQTITFTLKNSNITRVICYVFFNIHVTVATACLAKGAKVLAVGMNVARRCRISVPAIALFISSFPFSHHVRKRVTAE